MMWHPHRPAVVLLLPLLLAVGGPAVRGDSTTDPSAAPQPVMTLDASTWESARGLLPEEFLQRYRDGQWAHDVFELPPGTILSDPDFDAAGEANRGRYTLGPRGDIVEVATSRQPTFVYGPPFPDIDPNDPQAGTKIVWNYFYQAYGLGNTRAHAHIDWIGKSGMERRIATDITQKYFDGQPPDLRPESNPQNFLYQQHTFIAWPTDLQGTVSLTHRFRDPERRDQVWTYVPALRRVRAVSPVNRSDGFMGSDISQDDGQYFDGKPEDFTWKLVGQADLLIPLDRAATIDRLNRIQPLPGGGFEGIDSGLPRFAYQADGVAGLPWAPLREAMVLVKRPAWIVEGIPRDPYYLYGKLVLRFDKQSWRGSYSSKYDWKGEILASFLFLSGPFYRVGDSWRWYASHQMSLSQNWKLERATATYPSPKRPQTQTRIPLPDQMFSVDGLSRIGK